MNEYLLLHGSWHGAWCWFKVAPRLRAFGEKPGATPAVEARAQRPLERARPSNPVRRAPRHLRGSRPPRGAGCGAGWTGGATCAGGVAWIGGDGVGGSVAFVPSA